MDQISFSIEKKMVQYLKIPSHSTLCLIKKWNLTKIGTSKFLLWIDYFKINIKCGDSTDYVSIVWMYNVDHSVLSFWDYISN